MGGAPIRHDAAALPGLIARAESAVGPDRALEQEIWRALGAKPNRMGALTLNHWLPMSYSITASTDAVLALVGQVLPGWIVRLDIWPGEAEAGVEPDWKNLDQPRTGSFGTATAKTPALALIAALLRALIARATP